jgi:PAS domain S-box-containing protein
LESAVEQMNSSEINENESAVRPPRMSPRLAQLRSYALAALSVGFSTGVLLIFERYGYRPATGMLMCVAVAISAWCLERGPAVLSLILALLSMEYFFVEPRYSFRVAISDLPYFTVFVSLAALVFWFSTVRRRIEASLLQTRDKLRIEVEERSSLLDLTHDAIFVRNMNALISYWNQGAEKFYGWTKEEVLGRRSHDLLRTVFPKPIQEIEAELLQTGYWEGELTHTKRDGVQAIMASRWSLRRDQQGRPLAILETGNDITTRKHWEEEIQGLNRELAKRSLSLEASNKELEAFAYSISHDLRAPLRHMAGFAELLRKSAAEFLNAKSQRYLTMILEAANRMGNLIDDLLAFSRISRAEAQKSIVDLGQVVQEAVADIRRDAKERNITWKIDRLPTCYGDRSMLRLAFVNLISNAVKFTRTRPQAEIEIGCTDKDHGNPVLFVRDNGVGFDMKYSNKLFGVFQRLHPQEAFEGTGIGLATVQRIVHRHGGRIWAESIVDSGTTFYFSLPEITRS